MPRKKLIRTSDFPYHITTRSNHKWWFNVEKPKVWRIFLEALEHAHGKYPIEFHGAVCMDNHYHMVIRTPKENIDKFMFEFNMRFSLRIRMESKLINRMLGKRYFWSIITDQFHYLQVMKYLYRNPVKAGIVENVQDYPYSSLFHQMNSLSLPVTPAPFENFESRPVLEWLNSAYSEDQERSIKVGLKKSKFEFGKIYRGKKAPEFGGCSISY